ncbi:MAG TPA: hypothetical protein VMW27_24120 [Thermoanaerobaculia bacterium]|nr:hypothetical protein [Thermoanaerobaculia bacterium]
MLLAGCATGQAPRPVSGPGSDVPPWRIPETAFGSQRLYRASYKGPEGEGSFRVTLRLAAADRYQIQAVDPVGRALWSLDVAGDRGLSLNHRSRTYCLLEGSFDLSGAALGPFPLLSLPSLLLERLPAEPAEPAVEKGREISFHDASGRRWAATRGADGRLESWVLRERDVPTVWWVRRDGWSILSDRERGMQVRWREVLHEDLGGELAALERPPAYREECRETDMPDAERQD